MADFGIRFLICNIFICVITGIFLVVKRMLEHHLTGRMRFHLWFLLLGLWAVPFVPFRPSGFSRIFLWLASLKNAPSSSTNVFAETTSGINASALSNQMNDFALSVSSATPSVVGFLLCGIWLTGILAMILSVVKSQNRLRALKKSALPLQNKEIRTLYNDCLVETKIKKEIPLYSTAFLKSPIMAGLFRPCIYLPIHLISDYNVQDIRHMLLHELQHYKHKDAVAGCLMNLFGILYWFNPLVWYTLKEMRNDREIACDASVLDLLNESDYADYGNTLIDLAEKISLTPLSFTVGISGNMKQMQKRIIQISSYQKPSIRKKLKGIALFTAIALIFSGFAPMLSASATDRNHYQWNTTSENVSVIDLSAYFHEYEGSFVLYDQKNDTWQIYDIERAVFRTSPNSTYKIYDALFGLEEGIITPGHSSITWDGTQYPFEAWNTDQNLYSAMNASVNWYFQEIDTRLGASVIKNYVQKIGYGNENISGGLSSYWMQSSLKISPVEQVLLLRELYDNDFAFSPENVKAVKDSIFLRSSDGRRLYGKTGTGRIDEQDVNGWFIGFVETDDNLYFFAVNMQSEADASGSHATEITMSILSDLGILSSESIRY